MFGKTMSDSCWLGHRSNINVEHIFCHVYAFRLKFHTVVQWLHNPACAECQGGSSAAGLPAFSHHEKMSASLKMIDCELTFWRYLICKNSEPWSGLDLVYATHYTEGEFAWSFDGRISWIYFVCCEILEQIGQKSHCMK